MEDEIPYAITLGPAPRSHGLCLRRRETCNSGAGSTDCAPPRRGEARALRSSKGMKLMTLGARDYGISAGGSGWRFIPWRSLMTAAVMLVAVAAARADTPLPQDQLFKSWTLICRKAPVAQEAGTTPEPYCRIYHRVRAQEDNTKVIFI